MILKSQLSVEAHAYAATAYVTGPLTAGVAARAITLCRALPPAIRGVRVDLRAMSVCDIDALVMLEAYIVEWSADRRGVSGVVYPRRGSRDAFVSIPCANRDALESELRPERDDSSCLDATLPVR